MMKRVISCLLLAATLAASLLLLASCKEKTVRVAMEVQDFGTIQLELYPEKAPETVANFEKLVKEGFYDGLTFHRIIKGFMIQGGDPKGNGTGGSDETIKGEFSANGFTKNDISHKRGVISMARSGMSYDSASSQFFIVHEDSTFLDGQYAAFGMVTDGMDVVDAIANVKVKSGAGDSSPSVPLNKVIITRIYMIED